MPNIRIQDAECIQFKDLTAGLAGLKQWTLFEAGRFLPKFCYVSYFTFFYSFLKQSRWPKTAIKTYFVLSASGPDEHSAFCALGGLAAWCHGRISGTDVHRQIKKRKQSK